jgi:hypothetical protein
MLTLPKNEERIYIAFDKEGLGIEKNPVKG